jgi:hypothetical protein
MREPQLGSQEGAKRLDAAAELLPQIMSHPLTSMEGVLDRQGPIWDMVQEHASYDEETTDFVDPLRLSDQAVFRDGSVLVWSLTDGWVASRGEHSPFPHMRLIRHDGGADAAGEVARGGPLLAAVIAARAGFISSLLPIPSRAGAGAEPKPAHR